MLFNIENLFSAIEIMVSTIKTIVLAVETTVRHRKIRFSAVVGFASQLETRITA